jgi:type II secretory pathway predicted ATPase ExeA
MIASKAPTAGLRGSPAERTIPLNPSIFDPGDTRCRKLAARVCLSLLTFDKKRKFIISGATFPTHRPGLHPWGNHSILMASAGFPPALDWSNFGPCYKASTAKQVPGAEYRKVDTGSALDIYTAHFGLKERPFSLVPDPDFLFWSGAHQRAYATLEYGILTRAPITLITGEVGAGKTTLLHHLLRSVGEDVRIGFVANAQGARGELLHWVMQALDRPLPPGASYVSLFSQFQDFLISEYALGKRVILIFDEAQNLSRESLEELRMFTNVNSGKNELLQLVLVGQPELLDMVRRPDLSQFAQRVAASFHLPAMDAPTVQRYISHRLRVAGTALDIFTPEAVALVHEATRGVPRLVNRLCDLAMVYAFTKEQFTISRLTVLQVLNDKVFFGGDRLARNPPPPMFRAVAREPHLGPDIAK